MSVWYIGAAAVLVVVAVSSYGESSTDASAYFFLVITLFIFNCL